MAKNYQSKNSKAVDALLEEHKDLRELTETICATSDLALLLPMLDELSHELRDHFASEEAPDGLGAVVSESAPHKATAVDHLFAEHADFLTAVRRLHHTVEACLAGPMAEVRTLAAHLCKQLRKHEDKEKDLLTDALYTDIGGG